MLERTAFIMFNDLGSEIVAAGKSVILIGCGLRYSLGFSFILKVDIISDIFNLNRFSLAF